MSTLRRARDLCVWTRDLGVLFQSPRLILDRFVDFTTMDGHMLGCLNTEANLIAANLDHGHRDVVTDDDALVFLAGENQHSGSSLVLIALGADRSRAVSSNYSQGSSECHAPAPWAGAA